MYTILMRKTDKSLIATKRQTLYEGEKLCDTLQFLFPSFYEDYDLRQCQVLLKFQDADHVDHTETLTIDDEPYKEDFLRATLPVDSKINSYASDVFLRLSFVTMVDGKPEYLLHSGQTKITILPVDDETNCEHDGWIM